MIVSLPELQVALVGAGAFTAGQLALVNLLQPKAQAAVIDALGYNPETLRATEYYPRGEDMGTRLLASGEPGRYESSGGRAVYVNPETAEYLQLLRIPVRTVHSVFVDYDGRFGQRAGAFAASTEWDAGVDFYLESEQDGYCRSGCLVASTGWPVTPGSVKVDYTAGFSQEEFSGRASSGINAAGIHEAVMITTINAVHQFLTKQRNSRVGFVPGPVISERLGDYSYTLDASSAAAAAGFEVNVPAGALNKLAKFRHYGAMLT